MPPVAAVTAISPSDMWRPAHPGWMVRGRGDRGHLAQCTAARSLHAASNGSQRSILPIPDRTITALVTYDAKDPDTEFPPIEPLRPPEGAPNVLVVLIDDVGFGASSAFGGPCQHADRRAAGRAAG